MSFQYMKQRFGRGCQYQSSPWSKDTEPLGHKCKKREKKYSFVYIVPVLSVYLTENKANTYKSSARLTD